MPTGGDGTAYMGEKKEPELPKFTNNPNPSFRKVDPALTRKGKNPFMDYTGSKNTFKNFAKRGGISGFLNRRLSPEIKPTKFKKPLFSRAAGSKLAKMGGFGKFAKGTVNVLSKMGPKGRLVAGGLLAGGALTAALLNRKKDKKSKVPVVPYQGTNVIERDPKSPDFGKVKQSTASPEIKSRNIKATSYYDKKDLSRSGPLAKSFYGPGGTGKKSFSLDNPNPSGFVTIKKDYLKPKVSTQTQGVYGKPYKFNGKTYKPPAYGSSVKEETMTPAQKRKDTMLKKKYEKSDDMMDSFKDQYGKKKGKEVFYAFIRKKSMEPKKVEEKLDKKDIPFLKDLAGKLSDGAKKHKRQSEKIKLALNTEDTAIESELVIQDWNKDDIKFTEIETVDIIKAKPLKESMSNWREDLGEDWQKVNRQDKTDGLSKKAVKAYRRENPGSKLQTAVTKDPKKLKKGSKDAKRRLSFCRRMKGMKKKLTSAKTRRDPDSRINKALRRWNC